MGFTHVKKEEKTPLYACLVVPQSAEDPGSKGHKHAIGEWQLTEPFLQKDHRCNNLEKSKASTWLWSCNTGETSDVWLLLQEELRGHPNSRSASFNLGSLISLSQPRRDSQSKDYPLIPPLSLVAKTCIVWRVFLKIFPQSTVVRFQFALAPLYKGREKCGWFKKKGKQPKDNQQNKTNKQKATVETNLR